MTEPLNGGRVTNAQLFRAIDDVKELFRAEMATLRGELQTLKDDRKDRTVFRQILVVSLIAALVSGGISALVALLP